VVFTIPECGSDFGKRARETAILEVSFTDTSGWFYQTLGRTNEVRSI